MTAVRPGAAAGQPFRAGRVLRHIDWHHPEWCGVAVSVAAWLVLIVAAAASPGHLGGGGDAHGPLGAVSHAGVMAAAMMTPLALPQVHHVASFSLWRRRYRAALLFLLGFLGLWTAVGSLLILGGSWLTSRVGSTAAVTVAFALAAAVHLQPARQRLLRSCLATIPLRPSGSTADLDCIRFGLIAGRGCVATCWALMAAAAVSHGTVVMAMATALPLVERRRGRLPSRVAILMVAGVGAVALGLS